MSSPIQTLKKGILAGDWDLVVKGFVAMTGDETVEAPSPSGDDHSVVLRSIIQLAEDALQPAPAPKKGKKTAPAKLTKNKKRVVEKVEEEDEQDEDDEEIDLQDDEPIRSRSKRPRPGRIVEDDDDPVSARAGEIRKGKPRHGEVEGDVQRFSAQPNAGKGKKACNKVPWEPPTENKFKDDPKNMFKELAKESKLQSKKQKPSERREGQSYVKVQCRQCGTKEVVDPVMAVQGDNENGNRYICNDCVSGVRGK